MIRSGRIDVTVLGAYEVAANGDFANWKMAGQKGGGIGGAMDLAACAKHVFVAMEQSTRRGAPRLVERCAIPVTARGVVDLVVTNYGLFAFTPEGMALKEIAPGVSLDEVKASTGCNLIVPPDLSAVKLRGYRRVATITRGAGRCNSRRRLSFWSPASRWPTRSRSWLSARAAPQAGAALMFPAEPAPWRQIRTGRRGLNKDYAPRAGTLP